MRNKKTIMIGILCTLVAIMTVGYALLAQQLNINGRASIDSTWKVEITNIIEKDIVGDATSKEVPSYTSTTANFSVGLIQPGDSITYDIEISNLGTLKAKLDSINLVMDENDAITYTTSGVQSGDKLGVGEKTTLTVKVEYNSYVTSQPTTTAKDLTVTINYVQDLGNDIVTYDTYSIGDVVNFAGSNWYVIRNSSSEEDYVTLLKDKVLTSDELGEYASDYVCETNDVLNEQYGCTTEGETVTPNSMPYYWSDTCHGIRNGYTDCDTSGCNGPHNDYEGSKVRELLEGTYINTLGEDNLKEIAGYKIRLITQDELLDNLGYSLDFHSAGDLMVTDNVPTWIYQDLGYTNNQGYWTMTPRSEDVGEIWLVGSNGTLRPRSVYFIWAINWGFSVRPVINLLKSSI